MNALLVSQCASWNLHTFSFADCWVAAKHASEHYLPLLFCDRYQLCSSLSYSNITGLTCFTVYICTHVLFVSEHTSSFLKECGWKKTLCKYSCRLSYSQHIQPCNAGAMNKRFFLFPSRSPHAKIQFRTKVFLLGPKRNIPPKTCMLCWGVV